MLKMYETKYGKCLYYYDDDIYESENGSYVVCAQDGNGEEYTIVFNCNYEVIEWYKN